MGYNLPLYELFEGKKYQKIILAVSVVALLFLELTIYFAVSSQAGQKSRILIMDPNGAKVYESEGGVLTPYEKMVFEKSFGPLQNFSTRVETEMVPFAFRSWVLLSIGAPLVLILLLAFLVQSYMFLLNGGDKEEPEPVMPSAAGKSRFGSLAGISRNVSILQIGFFIAVAVLTIWLVPALLGDFASSCIAAVKEYQWFFLGTAVFMGFLIIWVIYLRYRLNRQMLENQLSLEKYRVKQQLLLQSETPTPNLLTSGSDRAESAPEQFLK